MLNSREQTNSLTNNLFSILIDYVKKSKKLSDRLAVDWERIHLNVIENYATYQPSLETHEGWWKLNQHQQR
jgi:hypothetical protein